jgi:hypothetical protein
MESNASSKNAATRGGKRSKRPSEHRLAIIGIRTATSEIEAKTHGVKKGTLFDDENYIVRRGTEANRLIATAADLEAFIPNGDATSLQVEQIQEWVAVPERQEKPCSVKSLFR